MKVGIIRCRQTEDLCPGTADFACARQGQGAFVDYGAVAAVREKTVARAQMLIK